MRAVIFFVSVLVLVGLTFSVSAQPPPPPPPQESIIIIYNDSACSNQYIRTERVPEPSSTDCEPEETPRGNFSTIFECDTSDNVTYLVQQIYNNTLQCDTTPIISMTSKATAHTCASISVTFEGQTAMLYGHIECALPDVTSSFDSIIGLRQVAAEVVAHRKEAAAETHKSLRSLFARIFNL